jgi:hypothetical protein
MQSGNGLDHFLDIRKTEKATARKDGIVNR